MWLLHTTTLELHEFIGDDVPPYAILSHRWQNEQVTFKDVLKTRAEGLNGWEKIKTFCAIAKEYSLEYGWADTCCIDKKSSAELSEAINSMFKWYAKSSICLVYLHDVAKRQQIGDSEWFDRGWTLQELIAPKDVQFFTSSWKQLGSKKTFQNTIKSRTGIDLNEVTPRFSDVPINPNISVAQRMSWASRRTTTRAEDEAYCLLGLFSVNMPLLYGEGRFNAFRRLQVAILSVSGDETILAWTPLPYPDRSIKTQTLVPGSKAFLPLLAPSVAAFERSSNLSAKDTALYPLFWPTTRSLIFKARLFPYWPDGLAGPRIYQMTLSYYCNDLDSNNNLPTSYRKFLARYTGGFCCLGEPMSQDTLKLCCDCCQGAQREISREKQDIQQVEVAFEVDLSVSYVGFLNGFDHPHYHWPHKREFVKHSKSCYWSKYIQDIRKFEEYLYRFGSRSIDGKHTNGPSNPQPILSSPMQTDDSDSAN